ncbi:salicylate hydroxylase [Hypoxylon fuscum]|nr:salicylate hydroxylase [Hypoxylon fuscum]
MSDSTSNPISIAIIGGGLAGISLANALIRHPHLRIQVFEAAPQFSERGAAVGLSTNAQRALDEVLGGSAEEALERAGAVSMNPMRMMVASGKAAGSLVADIKGISPPKVVHRASLLRELLSPLPSEILHANKKLASLQHDSNAESGSGGVTVSFQDGHIERFDAVIGADGIFGSVRRHVLVNDDQESRGRATAEASPAGFWDCRNIVPFEKAVAALGAETFEVDRQNIWMGDGAIVLHDVLENRTLVQCIVSAIEDKDENLESRGRATPLTRERLKGVLGKWRDRRFADGIADLILDQQDPKAYSQYHHKATPTYANGRLCIVGDAAHATTPWQGSGAGLAIEDAMVLGALLSETTSPDGLESAFKAFDAVRRPRCNRVVDSSQRTGEISTGQDQELGLDEPEKLRAALMPRWAFIIGLDVKEHQLEALEVLRGIREGDPGGMAGGF